MNKKKLLKVGLAFAAVASVFTVHAQGDAADEMKRLAALMGEKAGTKARSEERFLSTQADAFPTGSESSIAGAKRKKKSACSVRNDGLAGGG
jgi:hypothetical protein